MIKDSKGLTNNNLPQKDDINLMKRLKNLRMVFNIFRKEEYI